MNHSHISPIFSLGIAIPNLQVLVHDCKLLTTSKIEDARQIFLKFKHHNGDQRIYVEITVGFFPFYI